MFTTAVLGMWTTILVVVQAATAPHKNPGLYKDTRSEGVPVSEFSFHRVTSMATSATPLSIPPASHYT